MAILGIHHTAIVVPDLPKALDFYCGVLGFQSVQIGPIEPSTYAEEITQLKQPKALGHIVRAGWGYLEIWEFEHPVHPEHQFFWEPVNKYGIRHIALMVDDAMATYRYLKDHMIFHGEPVAHSVEGPDNIAYSAYGRDPFGNVIELWQLGHKDPQPFPPERLPHPEVADTFEGSAVKNGILGLHHTALVVPDLDQALDFYCGVLGFEKNQYGPIEPHPYAEVVTQLKKPAAQSYGRAYRLGVPRDLGVPESRLSRTSGRELPLQSVRPGAFQSDDRRLPGRLRAPQSGHGLPS